jgi:hypothetical protein
MIGLCWASQMLQTSILQNPADGDRRLRGAIARPLRELAALGTKDRLPHHDEKGRSK